MPGVAAPVLGSDCCVCLTSRGSGEPPAARALSCASLERGAPGCDAWLQSSEVEPPQRFFIPEQSAERLERELGVRKAAVDLSVRANGQAEVGELYLDRRPWRRLVP
jgi:hypothetical protein